MKKILLLLAALICLARLQGQKTTVTTTDSVRRWLTLGHSFGGILQMGYGPAASRGDRGHDHAELLVVYES